MKLPTTKLPAALLALLPFSLQEQCTAMDLIKGERLFDLGQLPERMFYVCNGEAVLQRTGLHGDCLVLQRVRQGFISEASLQ